VCIARVCSGERCGNGLSYSAYTDQTCSVHTTDCEGTMTWTQCHTQLKGREPEWAIPTKGVGNELKCLKMH